jgi:hypothetical protein
MALNCEDLQACNLETSDAIPVKFPSPTPVPSCSDYDNHSTAHRLSFALLISTPEIERQLLCHACHADSQNTQAANSYF